MRDLKGGQEGMGEKNNPSPNFAQTPASSPSFAKFRCLHFLNTDNLSLFSMSDPQHLSLYSLMVNSSSLPLHVAPSTSKVNPG